MTLNAHWLTPNTGMHLGSVPEWSTLIEHADTIREALPRCGVLFADDLPVNPADQAAFARLFGEPVIDPHPAFDVHSEHPEVSSVVNDATHPPDINVWHTDTTFHEAPATVCVLQCVECPERGGDTLWASMTAAFRTLSTPMQTFIRALRAEHRLSLDAVPPERARDIGERPIAAIHPVVRTIPQTGEASLFVNRHYTQRIVELNRFESAGVLAALFDHAESPDLQVRFRWRPGSVAIWDNRLTQHFASADYAPARRVMHRVALAGEAVIPA